MAPKGKKSISEDFVKAKQEYHVQSEKAYKDYMQNGHESIKATLKEIQANIDRYVTLLRANREEFRTASEPNPPDMEHIASVINTRRRDALELARDKPSKTSRAIPSGVRAQRTQENPVRYNLNWYNHAKSALQSIECYHYKNNFSPSANLEAGMLGFINAEEKRKALRGELKHYRQNQKPKTGSEPRPSKPRPSKPSTDGELRKSQPKTGIAVKVFPVF